MREDSFFRTRVSEDLVVEGVQQNCPFPILLPDLQHRHVGNDDLNRFCCVPMASNLVCKDMAFFSKRLVGVLSGLGVNTGVLAALVGQMV